MADYDFAMRALREHPLPPWAVGLAVFLIVFLLVQLTMSGGAPLIAVPSGIAAGLVYARRRRHRESP